MRLISTFLLGGMGKGVLIGLAVDVEALRNFFSKWRKRKLIVSPIRLFHFPTFLQKSTKTYAFESIFHSPPPSPERSHGGIRRARAQGTGNNFKF